MRVLNNIPAFYYGLIYLLLIPGYAYVYYKMPNNFYQSTSQYEEYEEGFQPKSELEDVILFGLDSQIHMNFMENNKSSLIISGTDTLNINRCRVRLNSLNYKNDSIYFEFNIQTSRIIFYLTTLSFALKPKNSFYLDSAVSIRQLHYDSDIFIKRTENEGGDIDYKIRDLLPLPEYVRRPAIFGAGIYGFIVITPKLQKQLNAFALGLNGLMTENDYWKMFYLSSVTITTLGYGDIVPISRKARMLISSEAILGIVLIGLFLNSIANQIRRRN